MKQIRVLDSQGQEYCYPIESAVAEVSVGRSESNDIILSSKTVSRRHAILKVMGDRVLLVNQSSNGVLVNGERIERVSELDFGEYATIEPYRLCVERVDESGNRQANQGYDDNRRHGSQARQQRGGRQRSEQRDGGRRERGDSGSHLETEPDPVGDRQAGQSEGRESVDDERSEPAIERKERSDDRDDAGGHGGGDDEIDDIYEFLGDIAPATDYTEPRVNLWGEEVEPIDREKRQELVEFKHKLHDELKQRLDLHSMEITNYRTPKIVRKVSEALKELLETYAHEIPAEFSKDQVFKELMDQVCGLGPIEDLIKHKGVSEIMVVDRDHIYAELDGQIVLTDRYFNDEKAMMTVIERIVTPRGRRIDESNPMVDTRLADGSRVNAIIPPLALKDPCLTIRKFPEDRLTVDDLVEFESLTAEMAKFLGRCVKARKNIIIAGGTGSGKTTLLNILSSFIQPEQRIVTIEDAAELQLHQEHVVSLETKPPNLEGEGEVDIRDLVKNALRMRPDRIVVGECRGGEALDMLQAMNTGHEGSMTTVHCNSPLEAISRLETLVMMSGMELPTRAIREQIANSVDLIVQQTRYHDGSRKISYVTEVLDLNDDGFIELEDIYRYKQTGMDEEMNVQGYHMATGYLPSFLNEFFVQGLADENDYF